MPRGRPKGSKNRTAEQKKDIRAAVEHSMAENDKITGRLTITDPIEATGLARHPSCATASEQVPFPSDWDKMGKVDRLKWLTEHRK